MLYSILLLIFASVNKPFEFKYLDEPFEHYEGVESSGGLIGLMSSNDLILIVLGVSLIIWFTLLAFLYRIDKKVTQLEKQYESDELIQN